MSNHDYDRYKSSSRHHSSHQMDLSTNFQHSKSNNLINSSSSSLYSQSDRHTSRERKYYDEVFKKILLIFSFKILISKVKKPLRQCGEWYEFLSSQNRIYYYNSNTEKTQWDKPVEWTLDE